MKLGILLAFWGLFITYGSCLAEPLKPEPGPPQLPRPEDAVAIIALDSSSGIIALADGIGGGRSGERAAQLALEEICKAMTKAGAESARTAIIDGFECANQAVLELGNGAGSTLAVLEISGNAVRPYHVGDSAIFVIGQRGKVKYQSIAHSPVGYAVESGLINEREAMAHSERHLISNFVGHPAMHIEVGPVLEMASRDTAVLASDGLTDNLQTREIANALRAGNLGQRLGEIFELSLARMKNPRSSKAGKPDDLTVVSFRRH